MNTLHAHLWTLDELASRVAAALAADYAGSGSNRVSDLPNPRGIRYYTTLGLLDRPAAMQGRTALYGRRHLLQLVAIKRLQAQGLSLAEIQQRLAALPDAAFEPLASVPATLGTPETAAPSGNVRRKRLAFWKEPDHPDPEPRAAPAVKSLQSLELAPGTILYLETPVPLTAADAAALHAAAAPLLRTINRLALTAKTIEGRHR